MDNKTNDQLVENVNSNNLNVSVNQRKKKKNHISTDLVLENNCVLGNESVDKKSSKKSKRHDKSLCVLESFTDNNIEETNSESTENVKGYNLNDSLVKKKKRLVHISSPVSTDVSMEDNCNTSYESLGTNSPKKKKKCKNSLCLVESTMDNKTEEKTYEELVENVNSNNLNGSVNQKKKKKNHISTDLVLENNCVLGNESVDKKSFKKSKKHDKSLCVLESFIDNNIEETNSESTDNVKSYNLNDSLVKKKKRLVHISSPISTDVSMEDNCNTSYESSGTNSPKKKKKCKNSLCMVESTMDNKTEEKTNEELVENVNSNNLNVSVNQKKKKKNHISTDLVLEYNCVLGNESVDKKSSKKSEKHDKSLCVLESFTDNNIEETNSESTDNVKGYNLNDSLVKKKKRLVHISSPVSTDVSMEDNCNTSYESLGTNSPKKKKKCKNSLCMVELTMNNQEEEKMIENTNNENIENVSNYDSNIRANKRKKHENQFLTDIKLEHNICDINDKSFETVSPKKKKKHIKSSCETEFTTSNNVEESCMYENHLLKKSKCLKPRIIKYFSDGINDISGMVDSINLLEKNLTECNDNKETNNENENYIETSFNENASHTIFNCDDNTFFNYDELDALLDNIGSHELENSVEEKKIRLNNFDLVDLLISSKSSLKNHPCYSSILSKFTKKIKDIVNNKLELVPQSDIELLKIIGEKILEKIIEKEDCFKSVQNLKIKLPHNHKIKYKMHYFETKLSRQPDKSTMDVIKTYNPLVKLGTFNDDEDNIIRKYWSKFQQKYNISDIRPFISSGLQMLLPHKEKLKFFRFLALELPNRLLCSVHTRFNYLFGKRVNKLSFKEEEDLIIIKVDNCNVIKNKYSVLSFILNRTRMQLYRRLNSLKMIPFRENRIYWDDEKRQELFTYIMLETNTDDWRDLKDLKIKKKTWIQIANRFSELISYEKLRAQWSFLSAMLFCETPIFYSTAKLKMLQHLLEINPKHWSDLNWTDITNALYPGSNAKVTSSLFLWWVHPNVPKEIRKNIRDTLKYLSRNCVDAVLRKIKRKKNYQFPRYTVEHYDLLVNNNN